MSARKLLVGPSINDVAVVMHCFQISTSLLKSINLQALRHHPCMTFSIDACDDKKVKNHCRKGDEIFLTLRDFMEMLMILDRFQVSARDKNAF